MSNNIRSATHRKVMAIPCRIVRTPCPAVVMHTRCIARLRLSIGVVCGRHVRETRTRLLEGSCHVNWVLTEKCVRDLTDRGRLADVESDDLPPGCEPLGSC